MTYSEWKTLKKSNVGKKQRRVIDFEYQNPQTARDYKKRLEEEKKKGLILNRPKHSTKHLTIKIFLKNRIPPTSRKVKRNGTQWKI